MSLSLTSENQLVILRASRLEALVPSLMTLLGQTQPEDVLAPQTVIAAHPGMRQWLVGALAREVGSAGVVANLDILLPSAWLEQVSRAHLDEAAQVSRFWQRESLRWAIWLYLDAGQLPDSRIRTYLQAGNEANAGDLARRRFQLADRLASVLTRYQVYRPDWLAAWAAGKTVFATKGLPGNDAMVALEQTLFAPLWQHLSQLASPDGRAAGGHRAQSIEQLCQHLRTARPALEPLHVFGFSHLPPGEQQLLQQWAQLAPVFLYLPDPCREYWGGLDARADATGYAGLRQWHDAEEKRIDAASGGEWLDPSASHPLLARWGRLGQHFYAGLASWEVQADIRHHGDTQAATPTNLLARVQESIRQLDIGLLHDAACEPATARDDASLRIHACHTRLRELEVLHDALLDAVACGIEPGDIVVMAPDISVYAPMLPAVFGPPAQAADTLLPWHMADVPMMHSHRIFTTFSRLLELGNSRLTLPDVADLLAVPEIACALQLEADARDALLGWLDESRVAWALDAAHREANDTPATHMHTLSWGLDRLMCSYVMADAAASRTAQAITLPDGSHLLPLAGVHGPASSALGALDTLLGELQKWRALSQKSQRASQWAEELGERLQALIHVAADDRSTQQVLSTLRSLIRRLASEPGRAGLDPELHFSVVRDVLSDALQDVPEQQRFLMGGITFCGMVPQRAIPFQMVCVLGLNDGEFPRQRRDGGIDLMARLRRIGDRDVRSDDRWLFLETLMSARQRLHLSWQGLGARDGAPRPPSAPLAELLAELEAAAGTDTSPPWLIQHPLQPFDARYFTGEDPALFSYAAHFAIQPDSRSPGLPAFLAGESDAPDPLPAILPLRSFTRFWKRPAHDLLGHRLQLHLENPDDNALRESEPLEPAFERIDSIAQNVFFQEALPQGFDAEGQPYWNGEHMPDWIRHGGLLPPGDLADIAWKDEVTAITALLNAAAARGVPANRGESVAVDITLPMGADADTSLHLRGHITQVYRSTADATDNTTLYLLRTFAKAGKGLRKINEMNIGEQLELFIEWAALRLSTPAPIPVRPCVLAEGESAWLDALIAWDEQFVLQPSAALLDDLKARLSTLVQLWHKASKTPPLYFPKTSQSVLDAHDKKAAKGEGISNDELADTAYGAFEGGSHTTGERYYAPGWTALLTRGINFDRYEHAEATQQARALYDYAWQLRQQIQLSPPEARA